jgi:hypothetical protein
MGCGGYWLPTAHRNTFELLSKKKKKSLDGKEILQRRNRDVTHSSSCRIKPW